MTEKRVLLFLLPIGVFLFHLGFSKANLWYLNKGARRAVGITNVFLYPAVLSLALAVVFRWFLAGEPTGLLPAWLGGVAGYYLSLILGILPFTGPFFREMDLEFFLLGVGVAEGARSPTLKLFGETLGGNSLTHWGLVFGAILGALFLSTITKYLITSRMGYYDREEEMVRGFVWGISVASGVVTIPLVLFIMALSG